MVTVNNVLLESDVVFHKMMRFGGYAAAPVTAFSKQVRLLAAATAADQLARLVVDHRSIHDEDEAPPLAGDLRAPAGHWYAAG